MSHVEFVLRYIGVGSTPKPKTRLNSAANFLEQQNNRGCLQYQITEYFASDNGQVRLN